jgi:hypothetical protein
LKYVNKKCLNFSLFCFLLAKKTRWRSEAAVNIYRIKMPSCAAWKTREQAASAAADYADQLVRGLRGEPVSVKILGEPHVDKNLVRLSLSSMGDAQDWLDGLRARLHLLRFGAFSRYRGAVPHYILSLAPGESFTHSSLTVALEIFLQELGYEAGDYPVFAVLHGGPDIEHLHLLACRIAPDGRLLQEGEGVRHVAIANAKTRIEEACGFSSLPPNADLPLPGDSGPQSRNRLALRALKPLGDIWKDIITIGHALGKKDQALDWATLHKICARHGVRYEPGPDGTARIFIPGHDRLSGAFGPFVSASSTD